MLRGYPAMDSGVTAVLFFLAISTTAFLLFQRFFDSASNRRKRLPQDPDNLRGQPILPEPWLQALSSTNPRYNDEGSNEMSGLLVSAGYRRPSALAEFRALRVGLLIVGLLTTGVLSVLSPDRFVFPVLGIGLITTLLAFSFPRLVVELKSRSRGQAISRGLPAALDLLSITLEAGLDQGQAALRVADALKRAYPELSDELRTTHRLTNYQSTESAWKGMSDRVRTEEVRNFTSIFIQSGQTGSDVASALREYSDAFRAGSRQRAERQANVASFWMLFPTISCLFVASAIVLVGPPYFGFFKGGESDQLRDIQKQSVPKIKTNPTRNPISTSPPGNS